MDRATLRHLATLAELSLSEDEEQRLTEDIGRIVGYVAELAAIDTEGVPPTTHVLGTEVESYAPSSVSALRSDAVLAGLSHEEALSAAPRTEHDGFSVPSFVE